MKPQTNIQEARPGCVIGGGIYAGQIPSFEPYGLILAPKKEGECDARWTFSPESIPGTQSLADGLANTIAMADAGLALGKWARGLTIGGFHDWYIPAAHEQQFLCDRFAGKLHDRVMIESAEHLDPVWYLSSTEDQQDPHYVWAFTYRADHERQGQVFKSNVHRVRAVRRVPIN